MQTSPNFPWKGAILRLRQNWWSTNTAKSAHSETKPDESSEPTKPDESSEPTKPDEIDNSNDTEDASNFWDRFDFEEFDDSCEYYELTDFLVVWCLYRSGLDWTTKVGLVLWWLWPR